MCRSERSGIFYGKKIDNDRLFQATDYRVIDKINTANFYPI